MDTLQSTIDSFGPCLIVVETSLQDCDDRLTALEAKCVTLEKSNKLLMAKTDDLESRSRHQNLRVLGIPENSEGPQITSFMTDFFAETLGMDIPDGPEMLDRAHCLASRPDLGPNAPPRPMIVRVHHFRVKQHIRGEGTTLFSRTTSRHFPGFHNRSRFAESIFQQYQAKTPGCKHQIWSAVPGSATDHAQQREVQLDRTGGCRDILHGHHSPGTPSR